MSARTLDVARNMTITLPPDAKVRALGPETHQVVWQSAGELRTFTATFTSEGRAVTQWFRRIDTWPLLLNKLRAAKEIPHVYVGGVATGEEAYSLAILLEANGVPARITATELNPELLAMAEAGVFTSGSVQQAVSVLTPAAVTASFRPDGDSFRVTNWIRERVTFERADLRTAALPDVDVFMLRNLWRHLGVPSAVHLASEVARVLPQLGVLSIGGADGLVDIEARDDLDAVLAAAGLAPVGVHDLYFRA